LNHLKCAAFELPLRDDEKVRAARGQTLCEFLQELGLVHPSGGAWHWTADSYPADAISLRSVTSDNFVVVDVTTDERIIAIVAFPAALVELHPKAIYLHEAQQFQVSGWTMKAARRTCGGSSATTSPTPSTIPR